MRYRVVLTYVESENPNSKQPERIPIYEDVEAGDIQVEYGCLVFKDSVGSLRIIKAFKAWENVTKLNGMTR